MLNLDPNTAIPNEPYQTIIRIISVACVWFDSVLKCAHAANGAGEITQAPLVVFNPGQPLFGASLTRQLLFRSGFHICI
jgi:hypothetical protein